MTSTSLLDAVDAGQIRLCKILVEGGSDVNEKKMDGTTVLMAACSLRVNRHYHLQKMRLIRTLIESGADLKAKNRRGKTCMDFIECHCPRVLTWISSKSSTAENNKSTIASLLKGSFRKLTLRLKSART
ncbi:hypothetical protein FSP39_007428 [Pinctada imbricata]|uniref:Uncharacterized protein n=1 Tax=Pinctada imbricata TaxID=66713 RepID=A0AA89CA45_PINIB|nr:hypothetical protein FSP39_007428 [Pinctada imbricata]